MKPKVAFFDFASCEGCQLQIANLEEEVEDIINIAEVVSFREVMKEHSDNYDMAFIEGSILRPIDEQRLKDIRAKAKILIALGDCASNGCVNKLRNRWPIQESKKEVYGNAGIEENPYFNLFEAKALDEIVEVDFHIRGCPVRKEQVLYYIKRFQTMPPHKNLDLRFDIHSRKIPVDERSIIQYDPNKCILCRRCETICNEALDIHAIGISQKGSNTIISTPFGIGLDNNKCIYCGQCLVNCPVGALSKLHLAIKKIIKNPFISALLITLRSLCKLMMNVMNESMGSGDLLSAMSSKNPRNVATSLTDLPESAVITVGENYFWHFLVRDVHFAQVAI